MEYRILGPVEVRDGGTTIPLDGEKQRTVLAALLLTETGFLSDTDLTSLLWGSRPPGTHNAQIYNYVSRLRKTVGGANIVRRSPGYRIEISTASLDLVDFEKLAKRGQGALAAGAYEEARRLLRSALALWHGPTLADVSEYLTNAERPRIEEARISVLESRIEADLAVGGHAEVLPELTRLVGQYPLRERFRAQLMTALYRCDRQAEALALYEDSRRMLAEELGVGPGVLLREVHHAILTAEDPTVTGAHGRERLCCRQATGQLLYRRRP
ncbi:AfsR/SARP family transcriptional regulator [Streptomyces sp. NBC_00690]|uniref:AfsR/SARP family transcriptional regulator n=1 Tax=unclassified Streptomyces TaxID=2593676 RepID=UPI002E2BBF59|nr:AfsR/SARP family transcriptional regulator [Streptomyces sp. NBC_00690]